MLHEYRKKTTIKAERFDGTSEMKKRYNIIDKAALANFYQGSRYELPTKEGLMGINAIGDWIATGIDGEHWVIADDIFKRTYERVD